MVDDFYYDLFAYKVSKQLWNVIVREENLNNQENLTGNPVTKGKFCNLYLFVPGRKSDYHINN